MAPTTPSKGRQEHVHFKSSTIGIQQSSTRSRPSLTGIVASRDLPENWTAMTLTDAAVVVGGGTPKRSEPAYWNGDVPWATPTDVTGLSGRIISETASSVTEAGLASSSATLLPTNSLLMTTRATIGACAINRVAMATNQGFQNLVPKRSTCVDFLYYLIKYHAGRLEQLAAGSTFLEISKRSIRSFRVHMPPISEQRKIAAILSSVDDAIEKTQAAIDQAQIAKRGLMQELFTRGLPGCHSRFQSTEVGELPKGWMFVPLGQIVDVRLSGVDKKIIPGEIYVRLCNYTDVYNHRVVRADMDYMEATVTQREIDNFNLEVGDVVITKDSETPHDIGVSALVREEVGDLICGYHLAILRPSGSFLNGEFLHYALSTNIVKQQFRKCANGITRFGLRRRDIEHVRIPLPPIIEQRMIAVICSSVDDIVEKNQAIMDRLQVVKSGLMPALLTGEVRVTPDTEAA